MVSIFINLEVSSSWNTLGLGGFRLVFGVGKMDGLSSAAFEWIVGIESRFHFRFHLFPFPGKINLLSKCFFDRLPMGRFTNMIQYANQLGVSNENAKVQTLLGAIDRYTDLQSSNTHLKKHNVLIKTLA